MEFQKFNKIPRFSRDIIITEKIDGTNAQIVIDENNNIKVGSRNRWITPEDDNYGFAKWVEKNKKELLKLGKGRHFGEWWGAGIQRKYGLINNDKRFSLFNIKKWSDNTIRPKCCNVVPVLYEGPIGIKEINWTINLLNTEGSKVSPGFMNPEGVIIYHTSSKSMFKKTCKNDEKNKYEL